MTSATEQWRRAQNLHGDATGSIHDDDARVFLYLFEKPANPVLHGGHFGMIDDDDFAGVGEKPGHGLGGESTTVDVV